MCPTPTSTPSSIRVRWVGPILSRCEMCNSRGWCPSAPSREKGETPTPVLARGWGQARAPAGGKAGWEEALVRHGAGGWGGLPPSCSSCLIHRVRRAAEGAGKTGPGGRAPSGFPEGKAGPIHVRKPGPPSCTQLSQVRATPPPPVPGHYCFFAPTGGGGWIAPRQATRSLTTGPGRQPLTGAAARRWAARGLHGSTLRPSRGLYVN